jgi:hypothetical protein
VLRELPAASRYSRLAHVKADIARVAGKSELASIAASKLDDGTDVVLDDERIENVSLEPCEFPVGAVPGVAAVSVSVFPVIRGVNELDRTTKARKRLADESRNDGHGAEDTAVIATMNKNGSNLK